LLAGADEKGSAAEAASGVQQETRNTYEEVVKAESNDERTNSTTTATTFHQAEVSGILDLSHPFEDHDNLEDDSDVDEI
jgi:hypothetical protein